MADRGLDASTEAALDDDFILPVFFVELRFKSGTVYLHTDLGDITTTTPAATWQGTGDLGTITEGLIETENLEIAPFRASLSGIDATLISYALDASEYVKREIFVYFAMRDVAAGDASLIAQPFELFAGRIDDLTVTSGGDTSSIALTAESELAAIDRSSNLFLTDAQLQRDFAGDLGLQYAHLMRDRTLTWGPPDSSQVVTFPGGGRSLTPYDSDERYYD